MKRFLHLNFYLLPLIFTLLNFNVLAQCPPDTNEPIFEFCSPTFTAELPSSGVFVFAPAMFAEATDDCTTDEDLVYSFSPSEVTCSDIGSSIQVTTSVFDLSGNTNQCQTLVFVEDNLPPQIICQNALTVALDQNGGLTLTPDLLVLAVIENCNLGYTIIPSIFDCSDVGSDVWVDVIASDQSSNEGTCQTLVSVVDRMPPTVGCLPNVTINLPETGMVSLDATHFNVVANDNCTLPDNLVISINPSSVDCSDVGNPVNILITVADESGNEETCTSNVTVVDAIPPVITCQAQINITLPASGQMIVDPLSVVLSSTDNCTDPADLNFFVIPSSVDCSYIGDTAVAVLTVSDESGNTSECQFLIIVEDILPPNLNCRSEVSIELGSEGKAQLSPDMFVSSVNDNCSYDISLSRDLVTCMNAGKEVKVKVKAIDKSGNESNCTSSLEVLDPKPESVVINGPRSITCGDRRVSFTSNITEGYGPYEYEWVIRKGTKNGWMITSGQGTPSIRMNAGTGQLILELTITDLCNKKVKDRYKTKCVSPSFRNIGSISSSFEKNYGLNDILIYPNPVTDKLVVELPDEMNSGVANVRLFNTHWKSYSLPGLTCEESNLGNIDVSNLPGGIYTVIFIFGDGEKVIKRFIKI